MSMTESVAQALEALHAQDVETATAQLRTSLDGLREDEVDAHAFRAFSDERLKEAVTQVEDALADLERLTAERADGDDVEGHRFRGYSDADLKQAVARVESALSLLRELEGGDPTPGDVEGHAMRAKW